MGKYDDLKKLDELRERGAVSEEEYQEEKRKILQGSDFSKELFGMPENSYIMLMHLSQFAGYIFAGFGFIVPVVLWVINKKNPNVDKHGKNIVNFLISWIIYYVAAGILIFLLIGVPILIALAVAQIIFIIMAAVKAEKGEYWKYPASITFIS